MAAPSYSITQVKLYKGGFVIPAHIKAHYPVSYADAFAVALAQEMDGPVVTGDPEFKRVEDEGLISVVWLPTKG